MAFFFFFFLLLPSVVSILQLYVPDEDKSIFGRSVNKQVFEGFTTGLLQTVATILASLWPRFSESGQGENMWISSPDAKVKSSATESFNTRAQDLIRYFCHRALYYFSNVASLRTWHLFFILRLLLVHRSLPLRWVESFHHHRSLTKCQISWCITLCIARIGVVWE